MVSLRPPSTKRSTPHHGGDDGAAASSSSKPKRSRTSASVASMAAEAGVSSTTTRESSKSAVPATLATPATPSSSAAATASREPVVALSIAAYAAFLAKHGSTPSPASRYSKDVLDQLFKVLAPVNITLVQLCQGVVDAEESEEARQLATFFAQQSSDADAPFPMLVALWQQFQDEYAENDQHALTEQRERAPAAADVDADADAGGIPDDETPAEDVSQALVRRRRIWRRHQVLMVHVSLLIQASTVVPGLAARGAVLAERLLSQHADDLMAVMDAHIGDMVRACAFLLRMLADVAANSVVQHLDFSHRAFGTFMATTLKPWVPLVDEKSQQPLVIDVRGSVIAAFAALVRRASPTNRLVLLNRRDLFHLVHKTLEVTTTPTAVGAYTDALWAACHDQHWTKTAKLDFFNHTTLEAFGQVLKAETCEPHVHPFLYQLFTNAELGLYFTEYGWSTAALATSHAKSGKAIRVHNLVALRFMATLQPMRFTGQRALLFRLLVALPELQAPFWEQLAASTAFQPRASFRWFINAGFLSAFLLSDIPDLRRHVAELPDIEPVCIPKPMTQTTFVHMIQHDNRLVRLVSIGLILSGLTRADAIAAQAAAAVDAVARETGSAASEAAGLVRFRERLGTQLSLQVPPIDKIVGLLSVETHVAGLIGILKVLLGYQRWMPSALRDHRFEWSAALAKIPTALANDAQLRPVLLDVFQSQPQLPWWKKLGDDKSMLHGLLRWAFSPKPHASVAQVAQLRSQLADQLVLWLTAQRLASEHDVRVLWANLSAVPAITPSAMSLWLAEVAQATRQLTNVQSVLAAAATSGDADRMSSLINTAIRLFAKEGTSFTVNTPPAVYFRKVLRDLVFQTPALAAPIREAIADVAPLSAAQVWFGPPASGASADACTAVTAIDLVTAYDHWAAAWTAYVYQQQVSRDDVAPLNSDSDAFMTTLRLPMHRALLLEGTPSALVPATLLYTVQQLNARGHDEAGDAAAPASASSMTPRWTTHAGERLIIQTALTLLTDCAYRQSDAIIGHAGWAAWRHAAAQLVATPLAYPALVQTAELLVACYRAGVDSTRLQAPIAEMVARVLSRTGGQFVLADRKVRETLITTLLPALQIDDVVAIIHAFAVDGRASSAPRLENQLDVALLERFANDLGARPVRDLRRLLSPPLMKLLMHYVLRHDVPAIEVMLAQNLAQHPIFRGSRPLPHGTLQSLAAFLAADDALMEGWIALVTAPRDVDVAADVSPAASKRAPLTLSKVRLLTAWVARDPTVARRLLDAPASSVVTADTPASLQAALLALRFHACACTADTASAFDAAGPAQLLQLTEAQIEAACAGTLPADAGVSWAVLWQQHATMLNVASDAAAHWTAVADALTRSTTAHGFPALKDAVDPGVVDGKTPSTAASMLGCLPHIVAAAPSALPPLVVALLAAVCGDLAPTPAALHLVAGLLQAARATAQPLDFAARPLLPTAFTLFLKRAAGLAALDITDPAGAEALAALSHACAAVVALPGAVAPSLLTVDACTTLLRHAEATVAAQPGTPADLRTPAAALMRAVYTAAPHLNASQTQLAPLYAPSYLTALMPYFQGKLSRYDLAVMAIVRHFESSTTRLSVSYVMRSFGAARLPATSPTDVDVHKLWQDHGPVVGKFRQGLGLLAYLDQRALAQTLHAFPSAMALAAALLADPDADATAVLRVHDGQPTQWYNPLFVLSMINLVLSDAEAMQTAHAQARAGMAAEEREADQQSLPAWILVLETATQTGLLPMALVAATSDALPVRHVAYDLITRFEQLAVAGEGIWRNSEQVAVVLMSLRNSVLAPYQVLPLGPALFYAQALMLMYRPAHTVYGTVQRIALGARDAPLHRIPGFKSFLDRTHADEIRPHRQWILRLVGDAIAPGRDWTLLTETRVVSTLLGLAGSSLVDAYSRQLLTAAVFKIARRIPVSAWTGDAVGLVPVCGASLNQVDWAALLCNASGLDEARGLDAAATAPRDGAPLRGVKTVAQIQARRREQTVAWLRVLAAMLAAAAAAWPAVADGAPLANADAAAAADSTASDSDSDSDPDSDSDAEAANDAVMYDAASTYALVETAGGAADDRRLIGRRLVDVLITVIDQLTTAAAAVAASADPGFLGTAYALVADACAALNGADTALRLPVPMLERFVAAWPFDAPGLPARTHAPPLPGSTALLFSTAPTAAPPTAACVDALLDAMARQARVDPATAWTPTALLWAVRHLRAAPAAARQALAHRVLLRHALLAHPAVWRAAPLADDDGVLEALAPAWQPWTLALDGGQAALQRDAALNLGMLRRLELAAAGGDAAAVQQLDARLESVVSRMALQDALQTDPVGPWRGYDALLHMNADPLGAF